MEKGASGAADVSYGIGEVEDVLGVKAHVIRYWEKEIPLIQPKKTSLTAGCAIVRRIFNCSCV